MTSLDNQTKIVLLLGIDIVFFFIEIISGYAVGSLALVADSFHMLNDIMSLVVALYAVRLVKKGGKSPNYSYGWQRAEILGALFNGVFLLALCFSIFMEALERLVAKPEVTNPMIVIIVGSLGLLSNIFGLILFNGHAHPHGGGHGHSHGSHGHHHDIESGHTHEEGEHDHDHEDAHEHEDEDEDDAEEHMNSRMNEIVGHPAKTRAFVMDKAHSLGYDNAPSSSSKKDGENQHLLSVDGSRGSYGTTGSSNNTPEPRARRLSQAEAATEEEVRRHRQSIGSAGHLHGNMNMTGVFLHVLGDAIGNFGVICTGAFILFTHYSWRHYADPLISFLIACIIFHSALPLVKSASFILLQGVPATVSLDGVRDSVLRIEGVLSVHDLHIWQLNENKNVASLHVMVDCSGKQSERYMHIADQIRRTLHIWGIHSSTIQPEFVPGGLTEAARMSGVPLASKNRFDEHGNLLTPDGQRVKEQVAERDMACLLTCESEECREAQCCERPVSSSSNTHSNKSS